MGMADSYAAHGNFTLTLYVVKPLDDISDQAYTLGRIGSKYTQSGQTLDDNGRKILHYLIAANE